jgi:acylphosphatase
VIVARRFHVSGRVQGVGYRFFVLEAAQVEGLRGWVRNLPDGDVDGVAEGDREAVDRFTHKLSRGPAQARVDHVDVQDDIPGGHGPGFTIR